MRRFLLLVFVTILCGAGVAMTAQWEYNTPGPLEAPVTVVLPKGESTLALGKKLQSAGVVRSGLLFAGIAKLQHVLGQAPLKAGEYAFASHRSLDEILAQLRAGRVVVHRLTVPEGLTNKQISALVANEPGLDGNVGALPAEGHLMPETYSFTLGESRSSIVQRMHAAAGHALDEAWSRRDIAAPIRSPDEALVMASLVEKETGVPEERGKVASVFYNRLKSGMKLQSDPTVIYPLSNGLGVIDRPLGHSDLGLQSPYNTYVNAGLPPAPICNPGRASLDAALHPVSSPYLYFVATGHGGHFFASTVQDHNRNVAEYVKTLHDGAHDK